MVNQPRDSNGHFLPQKIVNSEDEKVEFYLCEFECRVIANRLHRAAKRMDNVLNKVNLRFNQDCEYWARRFYNQCSRREEKDEEYYNNGKKRHTESDYHVKVILSDYECWTLGNRLFELGEFYEDKGEERIAAETKWLARRFHAEQKKAKKTE